jgi:hypothetical protein
VTILLEKPRVQMGVFTFEIGAAQKRLYKVESSRNFTEWTPLRDVMTDGNGRATVTEQFDEGNPFWWSRVRYPEGL